MQRRDARIGKRGHVLRVELESRMWLSDTRIGKCALVDAHDRGIRTLLRIDDNRSRNHKRGRTDESFLPHDLSS